MSNIAGILSRRRSDGGRFVAEFLSEQETMRELRSRVELMCESPIERLLILDLMQQLPTLFPEKIVLCNQVVEMDPANAGAILVMPQYQWSRFRIDIAIKFGFLDQPYLFIECDGAAYHSSPTQRSRDALKDRAIEDAEIASIRLTGSQIYRDAEDCLKGILAAIAYQ